jgi:hypothetical protein
MLKGPGTKEWSVKRRTNGEWIVVPIQKPAIQFSEEEGNLPIFAQEKKFSTTPGANEYIACGYDMFWGHYEKMTARNRRHYEIMLMNLPTHLHVDFEFYHEPNPEAESSKVLADFNDRVLRLLLDLGYVKDSKEVRIIDLSSNKPSKCSHHLLYKIRDGTAMFKNNFHCGAFMRRLAARAAIDKALYFRPEKASKDAEKTAFVADMAIYTMHRVFRVLGSSKFSGPVRPLELSDGAFSKKVFFDTLAQKTPEDRNVEILICLEENGCEPVSGGNRGVRTSGISTNILPMRTVPSDAVFDTRAPPCARAIVEAVRKIWDPEQRFDFKWYNPRTRTMRISSTSRRCRAKEKYTDGKELYHSQNHIYCDVNLRSKTFYQACYSEKNSEYHPCRCETEEGHFITIPSEDIPLPRILHDDIEKFLEGDKEKGELKKEFVKDYIGYIGSYGMKIPEGEK